MTLSTRLAFTVFVLAFFVVLGACQSAGPNALPATGAARPTVAGGEAPGIGALTLHFASVWTWGAGSLFGLTLPALLAVNLGLVIRAGNTPMPAAPNSDLKSILKALYIQQKFIRFAISVQGASDEELHSAFDRFCSEHQPDELEAPRQ